MPVFKAYLKVIRRKLPAMLIYFAVFMFLIVLLTVLYPKNTGGDFTAVRPRIAIVNEDTDAGIAAGLSRYLADTAEIVTLPQTSALQDALFFRDIEYVVRIPAGFSAALLQGDTGMTIEKTSVPDSTSAIYIDRLVARYLAAASRYALVRPQPDAARIDTLVRADLGESEPRQPDFGCARRPIAS